MVKAAFPLASARRLEQSSQYVAPADRDGGEDAADQQVVRDRDGQAEPWKNCELRRDGEQEADDDVRLDQGHGAGLLPAGGGRLLLGAVRSGRHLCSRHAG